jgi:hypothetical protein
MNKILITLIAVFIANLIGAQAYEINNIQKNNDKYETV